MKRYWILFIIITGICLKATAETESLNLEQCLVLAEQHNLELQNALLDLQEEKNQVENLWNLHLPNISATAGLSDSASLMEHEEGSVRGSYGFSLSHPILPGKRQERLQRQWDMELAELKYTAILRQLHITIENEFYYLITAKSNLDIEKNNLELARKRYEQSRIKFENGLTSELDVLQQRVNAANLEPDYNAQEASYRHRLSSFIQDLGMEPGSAVELNGSLEGDYLSLPALAQLNPLLENRSDVQIARLAIDRANSSLIAAKNGNLGPKATFSASWSQSFSDLQSGDPVKSDNGSLSLQFSLGLSSLIPGSSSQLNVDSMENSLIKAERELESIRLDARLELANLLDALETDWERVEISRLNLDLAERSYEMTETHYNLGKSDRLTVEDSQQKLLTARQNMLESQYQYRKDVLMIRQALGLDSLDQIREME